MGALRRCAAASLALGVVAASGAAIALADDINLSDAGVTEVRGLAWDAADGELFVLSGTDVLVLDQTGAKLGALTYPAPLEDPQALAFRDGYLFVGDTGDAQRSREFVTVYRMQADAGERNYRAWDFRYPDGATDAQAVLVSGKGRIYIVSTGADPGIFRASLEPSRSDVNDLERVADAPSGVTDAAFLADGTTMALRTADGVQVIDAMSFETTATTTYVGGQAGESLTAFSDSRLLVGGPAGLRDEAVPVSDSTVTPGPTPAPSATVNPGATPSAAPTTDGASPSPTTSEVAEPQTPSNISRQGTLMAVAGAVIVAVLAGALVFFVRD